MDPGSAFDINLNVKMIIMAVFGGAGSVFGPLLGAFVLAAISEILSSEVTTAASLFFGLIVVAAVVLMPRGLADLFYHFRQTGWHYFVNNVRLSGYELSARGITCNAMLQRPNCHQRR